MYNGKPYMSCVRYLSSFMHNHQHNCTAIIELWQKIYWNVVKCMPPGVMHFTKFSATWTHYKLYYNALVLRCFNFHLKFLYQAKFLDFKIQNMVGSCDVKFPIRLEGLVLTHGQFSRYAAADVLWPVAILSFNLRSVFGILICRLTATRVPDMVMLFV